MKGVVFTGNRQVEIQDFKDPTPGEGEVVLELKASGMCGSDLHIYRSPGGGPELAKKLGLGGGGAGMMPRGIGRWNGQYSIATTGLTMIGLPLSGS